MPYLYGERCPGWNDARKASFHDVKPAHTLADFYRAVQMGVLFNMYQCYEIMCENTGEPQEIIVSGGVTLSEAWLHMLADLFGRTMSISADQDSSSIGAVSVGLRAVGVTDALALGGGSAGARRNIEPDADSRPLMLDRYARFLELYRKN